MNKQYILKRSTLNNNALPNSFDEELNDAQRKVVYFNNGPLLVIAGAGSGKTKTLVYRVARLVNDGVSPASILLLTFTRKSAQEMLNRASTILDQRCNNVSGGTFHSFANIILREFGNHIGFDNNFTILDRSDAEDLISTIRKQVHKDKTEKRFPRKQTIATIISKSINTSKRITEILMDEFPQFFEFNDDIEKISAEYKSQKKAMQVMDYDDLLVQLLVLLDDCPDVRKQCQKRFKYIMVDEFQDTNKIQHEIILNLIGPEKNILVVGDDAQSIYSFRGADFKNIIDFPNQFKDTEVITLEQNYRSVQPILDLTNEVISHAQERYAKNLFTKNDGVQKPVFIETDSENTQSRFVCQKILELREEGTSLKDIAVLVRSGWHSNDLEVELKSRNIPFTKVGGFKFVEAAHVKDVISFLRIIFNPGDLVSWKRILLLTEGIGPKGALDIGYYISQRLKEPEHITCDPFIKKKYYTQLMTLVQLIFNKKNKTMSPAKLIDMILSFYKPLFKRHYEDYNKRKSDLDSIATISERYTSLEDFLSEMSLEPPETSQMDSEAKDSEDEYITISTIHSAKGLEWNTIFLLSAVDGYLPSFQSLGDSKQIEEERRLLYVALTRAKENLFIIKPNLEASSGQYYRYTGIQFSKLSRFLELENIKDLSETWSLIEENEPHSLPFDKQPLENEGLDLPPKSNKKYFF